jgi:hypothetical protein
MPEALVASVSLLSENLFGFSHQGKSNLVFASQSILFDAVDMKTQFRYSPVSGFV